jgi:hypothetical protein
VREWPTHHNLAVDGGAGLELEHLEQSGLASARDPPL